MKINNLWYTKTLALKLVFVGIQQEFMEGKPKLVSNLMSFQRGIFEILAFLSSEELYTLPEHHMLLAWEMAEGQVKLLEVV